MTLGTRSLLAYARSLLPDTKLNPSTCKQKPKLNPKLNPSTCREEALVRNEDRLNPQQCYKQNLKLNPKLNPITGLKVALVRNEGVSCPLVYCLV